ncbi:FISUMP domain-containing protein, partial [Bacteroidota bacterium]
MKKIIITFLSFLIIHVVYSQQTDSIIDIRDNQQYNIVKIGNQWWMQENLNVATYLNGDSIPNITNDTEWENLTTGARCYYNNDSIANSNTYSALYNWYTVDDSRNLCPIGWNVPTDAEWTILTDTLGGLGVAGGKMKEVGTTHWLTPNFGASNESGFTALPGGYRGSNGSFVGLGSYARFWSATEYNSSSVETLYLEYDTSTVTQGLDGKDLGFSARCLKDISLFGYLTISDLNLLALSSIQFDTIIQIQTDYLIDTIIITNTNAGDTIDISNIYTNTTEFSIDASSTQLLPGDSIWCKLTFNPTDTGNYSDTLYIESNDPYKPLIKIPLSGTAINETPSITINATESPQHTDIKIPFTITDAENDSVLLKTYYKGFDDWQLATTNFDNDSIGQSEYSDTLIWYSRTDEPIASGSWWIKIVPYDENEGETDSIEITLRNLEEYYVDSIIDIRDDQQYNIVKIGNQWWMQENLNVSTYLNGDPIPNVTDNAEWENLTTGGHCYYNNDSVSYSSTYGALYNWYTVNDSRKLCPIGWNVPSDAEWTILTDTLGGLSVAGSKMKEIGTTLWSFHNTDATNESGFTALPAGHRSNDGTFNSLSIDAFFWSSTENDSSFAWTHYLSTNYSGVNRHYYIKDIGFSVRCLKNIVSFGYLIITDTNYYEIQNVYFNSQGEIKNLIFFNQAADTVIISDISNNLPEFTVSASPDTILSGDSIHFNITFNPSSKGIYHDTLFIETNDPYDTLKTIPLYGFYPTDACENGVVIFENTTWTRANSPYFLDCNIAVDAGVTLTIEPGVTVIIDSLKKIIIDGELIVNGTEGDTIIFTNEGDDNFDQLYFRSTGTGEFSYFKIENANKGVYIDSNSINFSHGLIQNCGTGIELTGSYSEIDSVGFMNNTSYGLNAYNYSSGTVQNSTF